MTPERKREILATIKPLELAARMPERASTAPKSKSKAKVAPTPVGFTASGKALHGEGSFFSKRSNRVAPAPGVQLGIRVPTPPDAVSTPSPRTQTNVGFAPEAEVALRIPTDEGQEVLLRDAYGRPIPATTSQGHIIYQRGRRLQLILDERGQPIPVYLTAQRRTKPPVGVERRGQTQPLSDRATLTKKVKDIDRVPKTSPQKEASMYPERDSPIYSILTEEQIRQLPDEVLAEKYSVLHAELEMIIRSNPRMRHAQLIQDPEYRLLINQFTHTRNEMVRRNIRL